MNLLLILGAMYNLVQSVAIKYLSALDDSAGGGGDRWMVQRFIDT